MEENPYQSPQSEVTPSNDEQPRWPIAMRFGMLLWGTILGTVAGILLCPSGGVIGCAIAGAMLGMIADQVDSRMR